MLGAAGLDLVENLIQKIVENSDGLLFSGEDGADVNWD